MMKGFKIIFILAGLSLALAGTQCTYNKWPEPPAIPDTISFNKQLIPIFAANCTSGPCHNANYASYFPEPPLSLDSAVAYSSLLASGKGYVVPGNLYYSILYQQINEGLMPKAPYPPLSAVQI